MALSCRVMASPAAKATVPLLAIEHGADDARSTARRRQRLRERLVQAVQWLERLVVRRLYGRLLDTLLVTGGLIALTGDEAGPVRRAWRAGLRPVPTATCRRGPAAPGDPNRVW